jgi:hypothetical protein
MLNAAWNRVGAGVGAAVVIAALAGLAQAEVLTRVAVLTASQEVPTNASNGQGCARCIIDTDANTVTCIVVTGSPRPRTSTAWRAWRQRRVVHLPSATSRPASELHQEADILVLSTSIPRPSPAVRSAAGRLRRRDARCRQFLPSPSRAGYRAQHQPSPTSRLLHHVRRPAAPRPPPTSTACPPAPTRASHARRQPQGRLVEHPRPRNIWTACTSTSTPPSRLAADPRPDRQREPDASGEPAQAHGRRLRAHLQPRTNTMGFDERWRPRRRQRPHPRITPPTANAYVCAMRSPNAAWLWARRTSTTSSTRRRTSNHLPRVAIRARSPRQVHPCSPLVTDQPDNASAIPGGTASFRGHRDERCGTRPPVGARTGPTSPTAATSPALSAPNINPAARAMRATTTSSSPTCGNRPHHRRLAAAPPAT